MFLAISFLKYPLTTYLRLFIHSNTKENNVNRFVRFKKNKTNNDTFESSITYNVVCCGGPDRIPITKVQQ